MRPVFGGFHILNRINRNAPAYLYALHQSR
jgi:hypothetical protein